MLFTQKQEVNGVISSKRNHQSEKVVWIVIYHKDSDMNSLTYDEAVEEAICFGWIDSIVHKRDKESKYQYFTQGKPKAIGVRQIVSGLKKRTFLRFPFLKNESFLS
ncbi:MAG: hypothetical protein N3A69_04055, partial [Leptospiraceae bacterium]|nr:hypothetical protein [Leptospiraceae bacterium]